MISGWRIFLAIKTVVIPEILPLKMVSGYHAYNTGEQEPVMPSHSGSLHLTLAHFKYSMTGFL